MIAFADAVSSLFYARNEECDSLAWVLTFTTVGLLFSVCLIVAFGAPPFDGVETF